MGESNCIEISGSLEAPGTELIVTADDAGLRRDWDEAILRAASGAGAVVRAASLVVGGPTYESFRRRAADVPGLEAGVHLVIPELLPGGIRRPLSLGRAALYRLFGRWNRRRIRQEWERQLAKALEDGLRPWFLNSHLHLHQLPDLFGEIVQLAEHNGIPFVRVAGGCPMWMLGARPLFPSLIKDWGLWMTAELARWRLPATARVRAVRAWGAGFTGLPPMEQWRAMTKGMGPGTWEVICHPGQVVLGGTVARDNHRVESLRELQEKLSLQFTSFERLYGRYA